MTHVYIIILDFHDFASINQINGLKTFFGHHFAFKSFIKIGEKKIMGEEYCANLPFITSFFKDLC